MLLDPNPKTRREDLYDRDKELRELRRGLERGERLIVLVAPRRMGKTSLLNVFLNEVRNPYIFIDARALYVRGLSSYNLLKIVSQEFERILPIWRRLTKYVKMVKGFSIMGSTVLFNHREASLLDVFEAINSFARHEEQRFIVAIDEAQYLRYGRRFNTFLAYVVDRLELITTILTGSEVGLLYDFIGVEDPKSPLYGRAVKTIALSRFSREESFNFLVKGLEEMKARFRRSDVEEAIEKLNGVVGWLALFGYKYATEGVKIEGFIDLAASLVEEELKELFSKSRRYAYILRAIASGINTWSGIYDYLTVRIGPISRSNFNYLLQNLVRMGLLEYSGLRKSRYVIADPLILEATKKRLN